MEEGEAKNKRQSNITGWTWKNMVDIVSFPSHNVLPLLGTRLCPLVTVIRGAGHIK